MEIKFCIAKLIGTQPVYLTSIDRTWVSDIEDPTVRWYDNEADARDAVKTPMAYVVPKEHTDIRRQLEVLIRAFEALEDAKRVGAIGCLTTVHTNQELFEAVVETVIRDNSEDNFVSRHGYFKGIDICDARFLKEVRK